MLWFWLSILSAFSIASADAATKKGLSDYRARELLIVRFAGAGLLMSPVLLMQNWPATSWGFWGWMAVVMPLEVVAMLLYSRSIRDEALSKTLPYLAFTPVFTVITGYLFLGEQVSLVGASGIGLVVLGAWLLNIESVQVWRLSVLIKPFRSIVSNTGSRTMLLVALIYSFTAVIGKVAMNYVNPEFFGALYFCLLGGIVVVAGWIARIPVAKLMLRRPGWHFLIAILMSVMVMSHFQALQHVETAYMVAVKRSSLLFAIGFGALLFAEKNLGRHLAAGSMMMGGVAIIAVYG